MLSTALPLTLLHKFQSWDFTDGDYTSGPVTVPLSASFLHFHFLPDPPTIGNPIQLGDGFEMTVAVILMGATALEPSQFLIGTHWTSYGQTGLTVNGPDGNPIVNPGAILGVPAPSAGRQLRGRASSNSIPSITLHVLWQ